MIVDRAVIYSDQDMTSPVGFIKRGKKVLVGEIPRNKGQVYPIIVSGRVAYIRVNDLTTEKESMTSNKLTAERFKKAVVEVPQTKFVASYFAFNSTVELKDSNTVANNEPVFWQGISLKGEVLVKERFDVQLLTNLMSASEDQVTFRGVEFGVGGALRLFNSGRFLFRAESQLLFVPFSSYEVSDDFRVRSYGYTAGAGLNLTYLLRKNWGLEAFGGLYRTTILGFKAPAPYTEIAPTFTGSRVGLGFNVTY